MGSSARWVGVGIVVAGVFGCSSDEESSGGGGIGGATDGGAPGGGAANGGSPSGGGGAPGGGAPSGGAPNGGAPNGGAPNGGGAAGTPSGGAAGAGGSACAFTETFSGANGSAWPSPWTIAGGVATADIQNGRGRLIPSVSNYSLGRMKAPLGCVEAEVTFSFELTSGTTQGVGFYLRQNGGYLQQTNPTGRGYAVFVEAFQNPEGIGVWRELNGSEQLLAPVTPDALDPNVVYRVRFRLTQANATQSRLEAKVWPASASEPANFQIDHMDNTTPVLQGQSGDLAIDSWSVLTSGTPSALFVDDIVVTPP